MGVPGQPGTPMLLHLAFAIQALVSCKGGFPVHVTGNLFFYHPEERHQQRLPMAGSCRKEDAKWKLKLWEQEHQEFQAVRESISLGSVGEQYLGVLRAEWPHTSC